MNMKILGLFVIAMLALSMPMTFAYGFEGQYEDRPVPSTQTVDVTNDAYLQLYNKDVENNVVEEYNIVEGYTLDELKNKTVKEVWNTRYHENPFLSVWGKVWNIAEKGVQVTRDTTVFKKSVSWLPFVEEIQETETTETPYESVYQELDAQYENRVLINPYTAPVTEGTQLVNGPEFNANADDDTRYTYVVTNLGSTDSPDNGAVVDNRNDGPTIREVSKRTSGKAVVLQTAINTDLQDDQTIENTTGTDEASEETQTTGPLGLFIGTITDGISLFTNVLFGFLINLVN